MNKQELREMIKTQKMDQFVNDDKEYYRLSSQMVSNVLEFPLYNSSTSNSIALFVSKKASFEIYTDSLIAKTIEMGKKVYIPRCITATRDLEFLRIPDLDRDTQIGAFSLREPRIDIAREEEKYVFQQFDLVFVPGVAFDLRGNRLGFGSGYYDVFLHKLRESRPNLHIVALAFDFQVVDYEIPHNAKDEKVDYIITPTTIHPCNF